MKKRKRTKNSSGFSKYLVSILLLLLFEAVAVMLWLVKDNLFYLLNFSYIGCCLALGTALFTAGKRCARHFVQLAVGSYMLLYLGIISRENMQIEGFWYYLFLGVFEAATIHYAVAKIFGPLLFGRGWTATVGWLINGDSFDGGTYRLVYNGIAKSLVKAKMSYIPFSAESSPFKVIA